MLLRDEPLVVNIQALLFEHGFLHLRTLAVQSPLAGEPPKEEVTGQHTMTRDLWERRYLRGAGGRYLRGREMSERLQPLGYEAVVAELFQEEGISTNFKPSYLGSKGVRS